MHLTMNYKLRIIASLFLAHLIAFSGSSLAQNKPYLIGPRDILTLTIFAGGKQQREVDLTVSAAGMINVPFIGSVKAEGLTPNELEKQMIKPLARDYFVDPKVNIQIKEYHSLHYYISGAVKNPGLYETTTEATLLELIAKAGGVHAGSGNVAYIMRSHANESRPGKTPSPNSAREPDWTSVLKTEPVEGNHKPIRVDLKRLLDKGDMSANLTLEPGDVVYIPLQKSFNMAESKIYVEGQVKKPGIYEYHPGVTAMNACIMAGGFGQFAAPNRTRIIRQNKDDVEIIKINLNRVKDGKTPDIELKPGDRIHVPETWL
jgi:polysaccharide export outer membrane protein